VTGVTVSRLPGSTQQFGKLLRFFLRYDTACHQHFVDQEME